MNELIYNIKMLIGFVLIISFVLFWYIRLDYESKFHTNDFVGLNADFNISLEQNNKEDNIIYIKQNNISNESYSCISDIPYECENEKKYSIRCLSIIKQKSNGYYNGAFYRSEDNNCRK